MNHVSSTDFIWLSWRFTEEQTGSDSYWPISYNEIHIEHMIYVIESSADGMTSVFSW